MLPSIAISLNDKTQGAALIAHLCFFDSKNDSAVLIFEKATPNLVEINETCSTKLPKAIKNHDSSANHNVYTKTNDSAVYKITH